MALDIERTDIERAVKQLGTEWSKLIDRTEKAALRLSELTDAELQALGFTVAEITKLRVFQNVCDKAAAINKDQTSAVPQQVYNTMRKAAAALIIY